MYGREGNTLHCLLGMENKSVQYKLFNSKVTATISVSMVLFLLGIVAAVLFMSKNLSDQVKENFIFKLTLKEVVPDKDIVSIQRALQSKPYVKSVRFVSKDVAVKELKQQMGEDPMGFCDVNPLPNCFEISLKANQTQPDSLKLIQADLMHITQISQIDYSHELLDTFTHNIKAITVAFLLVAAVLLLISFTLINNTIRLLIYSNRFLLHTMKQVGATRSFIRKPYLRQGLIIGVAASALACFCLGCLCFFLDDLALFVDVKNPMLYVTSFSTILIAGVFITELSTYLAVNKYLRRNLESLYLI